MAGVRGFDDSEALKLPRERSVFHQPDDRNPAGRFHESADSQGPSVRIMILQAGWRKTIPSSMCSTLDGNAPSFAGG
jgi:hypothetical protein